MSEKDLVKELKAEVVEITKDRDDALAKVKSKESRMKQVLIKLEHREQDVHSCGHKIGEQNKKMAELEAKYISEALEFLKGNRSLTAKLLGLDRKTLYRKLKLNPREEDLSKADD